VSCLELDDCATIESYTKLPLESSSGHFLLLLTKPQLRNGYMESMNTFRC